MKKFTKYFGYTTRNTTEGGGSRNNAIIHELEKTGCEMYIYFPTNRLFRILKGLVFIVQLLAYKDEKIFIHYTIFRYMFTDRIICNPVVLYCIINVLSFSGSRNKIMIEVNDLPHEQAIDLDLPHNKLDLFDKKLYKLNNLKFVFASISMRNYVVKQHSLDDARTSVLINGSPLLSQSQVPLQKTQSNIINFVYAGSLNKGRQIEQLINIFNNTQHNLFLLGDGGEWIINEFGEFKNIKYLGSKTEHQALEFVASCDIGLIPYDDSKFYYNICFPTKASFYICAGIPFLSTNLEELKLHFGSEVAFYYSINDWGSFICEKLYPDLILSMKDNIKKISANYNWSNLIINWLNK
ncbi:MAG: hypothetical protein K2P52_04510 [Campylobacterales bacterium]|nr:hypothetical protein [Sphingobacteriaceae bacterium]MBY0540659.1 hypothetical protein [Campylobacterales bacterium]